MISAGLLESSRIRRVLCLGAHSDDIEIGCGGTVLSLIEKRPGLCVHWVVFSSNRQREQEARESARRFTSGAGESVVAIHSFRDGFFPYNGAEVKEVFEQLKRQIEPDLILTHCREEYHQDHRLVAELTWNTFRNHLVLEYEIPKYEGALVQPNCFVALDEPVAKRKVDYLMECFPTQVGKQWFSADLFWGQMRLRGVEANAPGRYAEGFYCRKLVL